MVELETPTVEPGTAEDILRDMAVILSGQDNGRFRIMADCLGIVANTVHNQVRMNQAIAIEVRKLKTELFAWRLCCALFGVFLVGVCLMVVIF